MCGSSDFGYPEEKDELYQWMSELIKGLLPADLVVAGYLAETER